MVLTGKESEKMQIDTTRFPRTLRFPVKRDPQPRQILSRTVGTPEHTELVEALMQNFPEIYETK